MKLTKKSKVTLVELPPTQFGILNGDIGYDVYSAFRLPSRATPTLEAILREDKWENVKSINPMYHGDKGKLTSDNFKNIFDSDVLLVSSITRTSPQSMELIRQYKQAKKDGIVIVGGFDPTFRYEAWLKFADIIVMGEGEATLKELMNRLTQDTKNLDDIAGIAYKNRDEIIVTKKRKLLTPDELSRLPLPYYDESVRKGVRQAVVETSRGCPFNCDHCTVTEFYGTKHRIKSSERVIDEIKHVKDMGKSLFFTDDNFAGNTNYAKELLKRIIEEDINNRFMSAQVSVAAAFNKELMGLFKKAGIKAVYVGFESNNDATLDGYGKPFNWKQNQEAAKIFKEYGFWVHGMMMPGGKGDTPESLREMLEWAKKNLDSVQFFPPCPLPGSKLYEQLKKEGRILTEDYSLYDAQHVIINPQNNFTPFELQTTVYDMYKDFYSPKEFLYRLMNNQNKKLHSFFFTYINLLGGKKKILEAPQSLEHLGYLKNLKCN